MAHAFIGAGQCGCGIVDAMFSHKNMFKVATPIVLNSATQDLMTLKNLGKKYWIGVSKTHGFVDGTTEGFDELVVGGFGKDPVKGGEIIKAHYSNLKKALKERIGGVGKDKRAAPVLFLAVGLGGGTGSGTSPYIARAIKELFDIPIIAIAVLPAVKEGSITAWNAWRCLNELFDYVDAYILVDNERIAQLESMESMFKQYNTYVAQSLTDLLLGTILEKIKSSDYALNPPVVDIQDIITAITFKSGLKSKPGFATIARVSDRVRPFSRYLVPVGGYQKVNVESLIERSFGRLTLKDVEPEECMKSLAMLRVPSYYLKRKGRINTNAVFQLLKERTTSHETHFGLSITKKNLASITLLVTYMPSILKRLRELEELAAEHEKVSSKLFDAYGGGLKAEELANAKASKIEKKMHEYDKEFIPKKEVEKRAKPGKKVTRKIKKTEKPKKEVKEKLKINKKLLNELSVSVLSEVAKKSKVELKKGMNKGDVVDSISKSEKLTPSLILKVLEKQKETQKIKKIKEELITLEKKSKEAKAAEAKKAKAAEAKKAKAAEAKKAKAAEAKKTKAAEAKKAKAAEAKNAKAAEAKKAKAAEAKKAKAAEAAEAKKTKAAEAKKTKAAEAAEAKKAKAAEAKKAKAAEAKKTKAAEAKKTKAAEAKKAKPVEAKKAKPVKKEELSDWDKNKISILEQMSLAPLVDVAKYSGIDAKKTWSKSKIIYELKKSENLTPGLVLYVLSNRIETPGIKKIKEELSKYA